MASLLERTFGFCFDWILMSIANVMGGFAFLIFMTTKIIIRDCIRPFFTSIGEPQTYRELVRDSMFAAKSVIWLWYLSIAWWLSWVPIVNRIVKLESRRSRRIMKLFDRLENCNTWDEYRDTCYGLDEALGLIQWRDVTEGSYAYNLVKERLEKLRSAWSSNNNQLVLSIIRSHSRNMGHIASPRLYKAAFSGTKFIIEEYICEIARSIDRMVKSQRGGLDFPDGSRHRIPIQNLLDFVFNTRQTIGRTALLLQGGATFGLIHIGVVRGLRKHGLLPRIILGDSTGALIAALVCTHREADLLDVLSGSGINLEAFAPHGGDSTPKGTNESSWDSFRTLARRSIRYWKHGNILDIRAIEECVKANVGDITFEEAYKKTKRILNIVIYRDQQEPLLLNYLNAPEVLIWTAAVVSSSSTNPLYGTPTEILCKKDNGRIIQWASTYPAALATNRKSDQPLRNEVLGRVRTQFHVNHFITSQARPSLAPFLRSDLHSPSHYQFSSMLKNLAGTLFGWYMWEFAHYTRQANRMGLVPQRWARYIVTEKIPGTHLTIVPEIKPWDFHHVLDSPTENRVEKWAHLGEKATWPAIQALRVRCVVEIELDRAYHFVRTQAGRNVAKISSWARFPPIGPVQKESSELAERPQLVRHNSDPAPENRLQITTMRRSNDGRTAPTETTSGQVGAEPSPQGQATAPAGQTEISNVEESGVHLNILVDENKELERELEQSGLDNNEVDYLEGGLDFTQPSLEVRRSGEDSRTMEEK